MRESKINLGDNIRLAAVLGEHDCHLRRLERDLSAKLTVRGTDIYLSGEDDEVTEAEQVVTHLLTLADAGVNITPLAVNYAISQRNNTDKLDVSLLTSAAYVTPRGRSIRPKTIGQAHYLQAIDRYSMVFAIGPAGTGKTFLAVLKAVEALKQREVAKIVLARPAVEAGEKLGFLPGDLQEKVNPYLRPVFDALNESLGIEGARKYLERGMIEVVPLAYMRGRTLDNAFIILDEAQNTTSPQMKMFLTRMGSNSRVVVTGDITQIDLPPGTASGLNEAKQRLQGISEIAFCYLTRADVVRHPLVQKIIDAYERS